MSTPSTAAAGSKATAPAHTPGSSPMNSAGLSAVMGYACATLFKTLASGVLVVFASVLALLKWMELQGFLVIQWPAIHAFLTAKAQLLDQNGDGKLDAKDVQVIASRFSTVMATTAPSAAGFVAGFSFGMM